MIISRWLGNIKKEKKEACRRNTIRGVEVRDLGKDHILCGEKFIYREKVLNLHDFFLVYGIISLYGLFATEKFLMCDILHTNCFAQPLPLTSRFFGIHF